MRPDFSALLKSHKRREIHGALILCLSARLTNNTSLVWNRDSVFSRGITLPGTEFLKDVRGVERHVRHHIVLPQSIIVGQILIEIYICFIYNHREFKQTV